MFDLIYFLDVSEGRPGMLVPLLSAPNTNLPYVQQMDEFLEPDSELYVADVGFGSVTRLSMTHIIASLAKPSAMMANAS